MNHGATAATVQRDGGSRTLVVAHRGAWDEAPQNSLEAVRRAAALGCDGVEIDVRRTADGRLIVVHDGRLGWRAVRRLSHREVQARMRAGQAPLLGDVLDAAAGRLLVDVEFKEDGYVEEAVALIAQRLPPDAYVVTSFLAGVLAQVKRHRPEVRTGLLVAPRAARQAGERVREAGADFLLPHVSLVRAGTGIVEWAAGQGLASWVWTVNDDRTLHALHADSRVAALITDVPARALAVSHLVDLADSRE
jgi:glycerophosphoryl diester phosphodiesterase